VTERATGNFQGSNTSLNLPTKSLKQLASDTPSSFIGQTIVLVFDYLLLVGWFGAIGAVIFHVLVFVSDMTSGHAFPYRVYLAVYVFINTSIAAVLCPRGLIATVCGWASIANLFYHFSSVGAALKVCVKARHDPRTKVKWERRSLRGLMCDPNVHLLVPGTIVLHGHCVALSLLSEEVMQTINGLYIASCVSLFVFFALLSITQNVILRTDNHFSLDFEAQSNTISQVSHKAIFLDRLGSFPGQSLSRWSSSKVKGKDQ
jgi:hypothetical protein